VIEEAVLPTVDFDLALQRAGELIGMLIGAFEAAGDHRPTTLAHYLEALHWRDEAMLAWERFFDQWDVLLCPAAMTTAFPHCEPGSQLLIDGHAVSYWLVSAHATLFSYTGHPAIVLPYRLDQSGLPIGVQIVGRRWAEARLLAAAQAIAQVTGDFRRPPGY
jgi:amidase